MVINQLIVQRILVAVAIIVIAAISFLATSTGNDSVTFSALTSSLFISLFSLAILKMAFAFCIWNINQWKEKREAMKKEEQNAILHYQMIEKIHNYLLKSESTVSSNSKSYKRKRAGFRKLRRRSFTGKSRSKLRNKLRQIRSSRLFNENLDHQNDSSEEEVKQCNQNMFASLSPEHSSSDLSSFLPQLHSTERDMSTNSKDSWQNSKLLPMSGEPHHKTDPPSTGILKYKDLYDPHPGLLAPPHPGLLAPPHPGLLAPPHQPLSCKSTQPTSACRPAIDVSEQACKIDPIIASIDCYDVIRVSNKDSGYHGGVNGSTSSSSSSSIDLSKVIKDVERYIGLKDEELAEEIEAAKVQAKSEVETLKTNFRLPPENVKYNRKQIFDCPELQTRKKLLRQMRQRIKVLQTEIESSKKKFSELSKKSEKPQKDLMSQMKINIAWQQQQDDRAEKARRGVIRTVKTAMEMRFRGMMNKRKSPVKFDDKNFCYDCVSGKHKDYFIDGVDGCPVEDGPKILMECDGFNPDCSVVKVINKWYKNVECAKYNTRKDKADAMESLLKKVLKETYLKRYYERGQLISQVYLTVSPHLADFVFISPKSSVPIIESY